MWTAPALALAIGRAGRRCCGRRRCRRPRRFWRRGSSRRLLRFGSASRGDRSRSPLSDAERRALRRIARKTWHFFTTFVGDDDHWLPPDNFQEVPDGRIAHRTSPTNTGLLLISTLAAHDLGTSAWARCSSGSSETFDTFDRLEKHWGHFYNWYDTRTLQPLPPRYFRRWIAATCWVAWSRSSRPAGKGRRAVTGHRRSSKG